MVSLWNELATNVGQELHDIADKSPVVAIKSLKVGDFQGNLLSTHVFHKHFLDFTFLGCGFFVGYIQVHFVKCSFTCNFRYIFVHPGQEHSASQPDYF